MRASGWRASLARGEREGERESKGKEQAGGNAFRTKRLGQKTDDLLVHYHNA